jgi:23S rRNA pseudouridine1911/1915/1917 synthase
MPKKKPADYSPAPASETKDSLTATVPADCAGLRFDAALAKMFPAHSRSRLQQWIKAGRLLLDERGAEVRTRVLGGEQVRLAPLSATPENAADDADSLDSLDDLAVPPAPTLVGPEPISLAVVYQDAELIVIDKPAGLVVHPGAGNRHGTLMNGLLHHFPELTEVPRAGIVHRLDKDTSGLLVVARSLTAQTDLVRQLQARTVKRHYLALALGRVEHDGRVDAPIGRHRTQRTKMAVLRPGAPGGREARTHYAVRERFERATLLECRLETGRTHQIRVHLASLGHPIAGDPVYGKTCSGDARLDAFARQALHAWRLALVHPQSGEEVAWESPLPADFSALLDSLRVAD